MGSYTVVITPHLPQVDTVEACAPQLTIQVDSDRPEPRVTGITISATGSTGLTSQTVADIDIVAIVEALASRFTPHVETRGPARALGITARPAPVAAASTSRTNDQLDDLVTTAPSNSTMTLFNDEATPNGRAYRRMPDAAELRSLYQRLGTVTGVAKHYDVPRHTAQGWMGRLRKLDQPNDQSTIVGDGQYSTPRTDLQE
ncbi:hypothetical protein NOVA_35825 [Nocardia nova]|uniref:hypothetical protein n=1 Tax=Nocardia nova TaxID=37330 RepID=UPI001C48177A|nr:hypothetical protein [Nocardia nova]MBV7708158.1 hypothetical protein [Nocardia nova]